MPLPLSQRFSPMTLSSPSPCSCAAGDNLARSLHAAVADEMRLIATLLERLAETVIGDEAFAARHIDELQSFDLVIQCAEESAGVLDRLASGSPAHDAVVPVRLTAVQDRLRHALDLAVAAAVDKAA
jgi:hypothetical protein